MGMYTTVWGEIEGFGMVDIQIYGGKDRLENYRVGDTVKWSVNANCVGDTHLTDGVYIGLFGIVTPEVKAKMEGEGRKWTTGGEMEFYDAYVAIKDHVIVAIGVLPSFDDDTDNVEREAILDHVYAQYAPSKEAVRKLYTHEAWARSETECAAAKARSDKWREEFAKKSHFDQMEELARVMVDPIKTSLEYASLGRKILNVDEK